MKLQDTKGNIIKEFHSFDDIDFKLWCLNEAFYVGIDKALMYDTRLEALIKDLHSITIKTNIKEFASWYPDDLDLIVCDDDFISILNPDLEDIVLTYLS